VAAAAVLPGVAAGEGAVLAGFAAVTALSIAWGSRRVFDDLAAWRWAVMYLTAAVAYGVGVSALGRFLDGPALPRGDSVGEWAIVALAVASAAGTLLTRWTRLAPVLRARLLDAGVPSAGWDAVPGRPALSVVRASDVDMLSIARRAA